MEVDRTPQLDRTDEANEVVPLILGALKLLDDFAGAAGAGSKDAAQDDEAVLAAALGLISVRRTLRRWIEQAACEHPLANEATHPASAVAADLLR
jgi:hypothetical protein